VGGTIWLADFILGIKFNYKNEKNRIISDEHVILRTKEYHKHQFEFEGEDYLQNMIMYEVDFKLVGISLISK
jgi:hypothetical protein